ncbi:hypothetical protein BH09PAT1_BH09PAT1_5320 [soil metagenome]
MKSWISIIFALIFLCAVVIFNIKQPKSALPNFINTPTATPTLSPTPTISSSACLPSALQATISFEPAAGNIYGTAKLTNASTQLCTIFINQQLQLALLPTIKNVKINYTNVLTPQTFTLQPKTSLYALVHMPNGPQCQSSLHQVQASLSYEIMPGQPIAFMNNNKSDFLINACQSSSDITTVDIATFSAKPLP